MRTTDINYSQCWEDPQTLSDALVISRDDVVLSVTSGGDNTLALLTEYPAKLVAIDFNSAQNHLFSLKHAAILSLPLEIASSFLGTSPADDRLEQYSHIRHNLSKESAEWWDARKRLLTKGVIHVGRFERFLKFFRKFVLPLIHSKQVLTSFLSSTSLEEQQRYYKDTWDSKRWRFLFHVFSNRFILERFARQPGMFTYRTEPMGAIYEKRLARMFNETLVQENYFLNYCLTGAYGLMLPPYFTKEIGTESLVEVVTSDLYSYLKQLPDEVFSKYNLSDLFEALSQEKNDHLWEEILRTARPNARVAYWNNLVDRTYPTHLAGKIRDEKSLAETLFLRERSCFYGSFHVHTLKPQ